MTGHDHAEIDLHVKKYIKVFVSLLFLTIITVAVSYIEMPHNFGIFVGLSIALVKASLVAGIFMHLIDELKGNKLWISMTIFFSILFFFS